MNDRQRTRNKINSKDPYKSGAMGFHATLSPVCPCGKLQEHKTSMLPKYKVNGVDWYFEFTCPKCGKKFLYWHSLFAKDKAPELMSLYVDEGYYEIESSGLILV